MAVVRRGNHGEPSDDVFDVAVPNEESLRTRIPNKILILCERHRGPLVPRNARELQQLGFPCCMWLSLEEATRLHAQLQAEIQRVSARAGQ
jgi:hypothetical protein